MERVSSFEPYKPGHIVAVRGPRRRKISELDDWDTPDGPGETVVMRIDNVAWVGYNVSLTGLTSGYRAFHCRTLPACWSVPTGPPSAGPHLH